MSVGDLPVMNSMAYQSSTANAAALMNTHLMQMGMANNAYAQSIYAPGEANWVQAQNPEPKIVPKPQKEKKPMASKRRYVQVFIADTNEHVPLTDAMVYVGEPKFTNLEPARIRDLTMTVVTIASF